MTPSGVNATAPGRPAGEPAERGRSGDLGFAAGDDPRRPADGVPAERIAGPLFDLLAELEDRGSRPVQTLLSRPDAWILGVDGTPGGSGTGRVLQVVPESGSLPPFGIRLAVADLRAFRPGSELGIERETGRLCCGSLAVDLDAGQRWAARPDWERLRGTPAPSFVGPRLPSAVPEVLRRGLDALAEALASGGGSGASALAAVRSLAGRGPGLTPAGDDVLLGAVHGLWASGGDGPRIAERWVEDAAPRTTRLSRAWLEAAARGEAGEVWEEYLAALSGRGSELAVARRKLLAWGATSGCCGLVGFELVCGGEGRAADGASL